MKRNLVSLLVVLIVILASFTGAKAQNIIQNGSFELPGFPNGQTNVGAPSSAITDWTVGGTGDVFIHDGTKNGGVLGPAQDGVYYLDLSGNGPPHATVYQDFATTPNTPYSLSFYIGSASNQVSPTIRVQLLGTSSLLDTTLTPLVPTTSIDWLKETFSFTSDSTTTRLSFVDTSGSDDNASFVDNVSVTSVPEPATLGLFCLSSLLLLRKR